MPNQEDYFFEVSMGLMSSDVKQKGFSRVNGYINVPGDGSCCFHAIHAAELINKQLYGDELTARTPQMLRIAIVDFALDADQRRIEAVLTKYGLQLEAWLSDMYGNAWGGTECLELYAMMTERKASIEAYYPTYTKGNQMQNFDYGNRKSPVNLFLDIAHFMCTPPAELSFQF